jgi:hypothetical protein
MNDRFQKVYEIVLRRGLIVIDKLQNDVTTRAKIAEITAKRCENKLDPVQIERNVTFDLKDIHFKGGEIRLTYFREHGICLDDNEIKQLLDN